MELVPASHNRGVIRTPLSSQSETQNIVFDQQALSGITLSRESEDHSGILAHIHEICKHGHASRASLR